MILRCSRLPYYLYCLRSHALNQIKLLQPYNQLFTAVFSAKESLFKALYPQAGFYFGFDYAALRHLEPDNHIMVFELIKPISKAFPKGKVIFTRYYFMGDKVFTLVAV
ncbi:4'-phosphopantetheinyl transferase superfamily protein [Candidatus Regiella insecticola]|uniref:4'-phosphopantetheinyl transferase superfamily protein n=1 Tax=Candidatus Regiella insecticola TaxID=138073 RepID=UPI0009D9F12E|nr:4'-phosphopantetheinyl transferase superfamily protein [Candidatus Regiella insecticola]